MRKHNSARVMLKVIETYYKIHQHEFALQEVAGSRVLRNWRVSHGNLNHTYPSSQ